MTLTVQWKQIGNGVTPFFLSLREVSVGVCVWLQVSCLLWLTSHGEKVRGFSISTNIHISTFEKQPSERIYAVSLSKHLGKYTVKYFRKTLYVLPLQARSSISDHYVILRRQLVYIFSANIAIRPIIIPMSNEQILSIIILMKYMHCQANLLARTMRFPFWQFTLRYKGKM